MSYPLDSTIDQSVEQYPVLKYRPNTGVHTCMSLRMKVIIPCRWDLPEEHGVPVLEGQGSIWAYWWCATLRDSRTRQSYNQRKYCWSCDPCSWINKVENIIASDLSVGILTSVDECLWIRKGTLGATQYCNTIKKKKIANTEIPVMLTIGSLLLLVITDRKHYTCTYNYICISV